MTQNTSQPGTLPRRPAFVFAVLAGLGLLVFAVGAASSDAETAERAYRVYLHNWLLWAGLAQGALVLSAAMRLTNARWQGPIQNLVDGLGAFVPVSLVLFFGVWLGRHELFEWTQHPVYGKEWWYSESFTFGRDLFALLWMTGLSGVYLYMTIRPQLGAARGRGSGWQALLVERFTAGWRGEDAERQLAERRLRKFAAVLALSYTLAYSLIALDMIMSLAPHWVSSLFPAYYAWGGFLSAVSLTALVAVLLRNSSFLVGEVTEQRRHDMGKMVFAFSIFWMYLFWSQYIVIWYGNIPEETGYLAARLGSQFLQETWYLQGFWTRVGEPYAMLTLLTWTLCWVTPFWVLLGREPKKTPGILAGVALGSVVGFWLERYILVTPSLVPPEAVLAGAPVTPFGFYELTIGLGFVGVFFLTFLAYTRVFPGSLPAREA